MEMSLWPADVPRVKRLMVELAAWMATGEVDLLAGCRRMAKLRAELDDETIDDPDVITFVEIDSELDAFPSGPSRAFWAPDLLAQKDKKKAEYLGRVRDDILRCCRNVLLKWSLQH
jgi:hypothetical protein